MKEKFFTIDITRNSSGLDNDYTFYKDGSIQHCYDQSMYKLNQERWIDANEISQGDKERIFNKCSVDQLDILKKHFNLYK